MSQFCWRGLLTFISLLFVRGGDPIGCCGGPEFLVQDRANIFQRLTLNFYLEIWANVNKQAKKFILQLLATDPNERPNAQQYQEDDWLNITSSVQTRRCLRRTIVVPTLLLPAAAGRGMASWREMKEFLHGTRNNPPGIKDVEDIRSGTGCCRDRVVVWRVRGHEDHRGR